MIIEMNPPYPIRKNKPKQSQFLLHSAGKKPAPLCPCLTFFLSFTSHGPALLLRRATLTMSTSPELASLGRFVTFTHSQLLTVLSRTTCISYMTNTCTNSQPGILPCCRYIKKIIVSSPHSQEKSPPNTNKKSPPKKQKTGNLQPPANNCKNTTN